MSAGTYNSSYVEIQPELLAGESVLWTGQPQKKAIFHLRDLVVVPLSLIVGGMCSLIGSRLMFNRESTSFLMGVFLVAASQHAMWGRYLYTAWRKGRTHYAVTTKRAIVLNAGLLSREMTDAYLVDLELISLSVRADGIGTIDFRQGGDRRWVSDQHADIDLSALIFWDIEDARSVYRLIQAQREQRRADRPTGVREHE